MGADYQIATTNIAGTGTPFLGKITILPVYRIAAPTGIPAPISPLTGATLLSDTVVFSWKGVSGASFYTITLAQDSLFGSGVQTISGNTDYTCSVVLASSTTYYWRIRAENPAAYSAWSATNSFRTPAAVQGIIQKSREHLSFCITGSNGILCYTVPHACFVRITYYDMQGRLAASLVNAVQPAGTYSLNPGKRFLSSGTYVQVFTAGEFSKTSVFHYSR